MADSGKLIVVSGFSGSGKGTVMKDITARYDNYALSISATTRSPRQGEEDGREYFFKTKEEFEKMIAEDKLIEYACYVGNYYGTPRDYVEKQLSAGRDVILEIEIQGAMKIRKRYPDALLVFMTPPSGRELIDRLRGRGTEDDSVIESRMRRALEEAEGVAAYDYILINDEIEKCSDRLNEMVKESRSADHAAPDKTGGIELINKIKTELNGLINERR